MEELIKLMEESYLKFQENVSTGRTKGKYNVFPKRIMCKISCIQGL